MLEPEFRLGRVDHHNLQLVLVLGAAAAAIAARQRPPSGAAAGGAAALSLAVGLETLPILAAAGGLVALTWALEDTAPDRRAAVWSSVGLAATLPLAMAGTLPPMALTTPLCDQLSPATAVPIVLSCLGLCALTVLLRRSGRGARLTGWPCPALRLRFRPRCSRRTA